MRGAKEYSKEFLSKLLNSEFTLPAYALDIFLSVRWNILALVVPLFQDFESFFLGSFRTTPVTQKQ